MPVLEKEPTVNDEASSAKDSEVITSHEQVGEIDVLSYDTETAISLGRSPEQSAQIESVISELESRAETINLSSAEAAMADIDRVEDPRLQEIAKKLDRLKTLESMLEIAKSEDQSRETEIRSRAMALFAEIKVAADQVQAIEASKTFHPTPQDLPSDAGMMDKAKYKLSSSYRERLFTDRQQQISQRLQKASSTEQSLTAEQKELTSSLSSESYRVSERASYEEFRSIIDDLRVFLSETVHQIGEEAKTETDPVKKAQLQSELLCIIKELSELNNKLYSLNSQYSGKIKNEYPLMNRFDIPGVRALFSEDLGSDSATYTESHQVVKIHNTEIADRAVCDFATKLFGDEHLDFSQARGQGSEFANSTLYTETSQLEGLEDAADVMKIVRRPSEMLDCLLTNEELDRINSALSVLYRSAGRKQYEGGFSGSPAEILSEIITSQRTLKEFLDRMNKGSIATHATSASNALLILRDGQLRSEVGAKASSQHVQSAEIANSTQGDIIDNRTISFSTDGVEDQFLESYNPNGDRPADMRTGIIFAKRTSELCHELPWFLQANTQTKSQNNSLELQIVDEEGIPVSEMDIFIDQRETQYWTSQLIAMGYDEAWITEHVHFIDFNKDKSTQISSELQSVDVTLETGVPYVAGVYKDVRREVHVSPMNLRNKVTVNERAPELVFPTKIYRM